MPATTTSSSLAVNEAKMPVLRRRIPLWLSLFVLMLFCALTPAQTAHAEGRELDGTFGDRGVLALDPQSSNAPIHEVVGLLAGGDVIVAAVNLWDANENPAGAMLIVLDKSGAPYGPGNELLNTTPSARYAGILALGPTDILVYGTVDGPAGEQRDFLIQRFQLDLQNNPMLTEDFDAAGPVGIYLGSDDVATSAFRMSNGKILVAGTATYSDEAHTDPTPHLAALRLNTDGSVDDTFGLDGSGRLDNNDFPGNVYAVAANSSGVIVLAGATIGTEQPILWRFSADGNTWLESLVEGSETGRYTSLSVLPGTNPEVLLAAGHELDVLLGPNLDLSYRYYNFDFDTPAGFTTGVKRLARPTSNDFLYAAAGEGDIVILIGTEDLGGSNSDANFLFTLMTKDGALFNSNYGVDGVATVDIAPRAGGLPGQIDTVSAAAFQFDGGVLLGGASFINSNGAQPVAVIVRLMPKTVVTQSVDKARVDVGERLTYRIAMTSTPSLTYRVTDTLTVGPTGNSLAVRLEDVTVSNSPDMEIAQVSSDPLAWDVRLPNTRGTITVTGIVTSASLFADIQYPITNSVGLPFTSTVAYVLPGGAVTTTQTSTIISPSVLSASVTADKKTVQIGEQLSLRAEFTTTPGLRIFYGVQVPEATIPCFLCDALPRPTYLTNITYTTSGGIDIDLFTALYPDLIFGGGRLPTGRATLLMTGTVTSTVPIIDSGGYSLTAVLPHNFASIVDAQTYTSTTTIHIPQSVIDVTKQVDKTQVRVGETLTYRLNMTGTPAVTFRLTETVPSSGPVGLTNLTVASSPEVNLTQIGTNPLVWDIVLSPPGSGSIAITGTVAATGPITGTEGVTLTNQVTYGFAGAPDAATSATTTVLGEEDPDDPDDPDTTSGFLPLVPVGKPPQ